MLLSVNTLGFITTSLSALPVTLDKRPTAKSPLGFLLCYQNWIGFSKFDKKEEKKRQHKYT